MLNEIDHLPEGLLELDATQLQGRLGGPTLIHLQGKRQPALFVSILMHGNETTGWDAVRRVLKGAMAGDQPGLPRALSLFIANTEAAAAGVRHLPQQPDFNRVWPGGEVSHGVEAEMMRQVVDIMATREMFAAVDVHNNTGMNPHYACVNVMEHQALHLASLFARTVVYFVRPRGVASMAMAALGPSVTLECGKVGQEHGASHAADYLAACLRLAEIPSHPVPLHDIDLFHTVAVVRVPEGLDFGFGDTRRTLDFNADLDRLNFRELPVGTGFGRYRAAADTEAAIPLQVRDERDRDVVTRYFEIDSGELRTRVPVMPSMLTRDATVIRQDCLCYLMERYNQHLSEAG